MIKFRVSAEDEIANGNRLPAWLVRCVVVGILAGLGGAATLLFGFGRF